MSSGAPVIPGALLAFKAVTVDAEGLLWPLAVDGGGPWVAGGVTEATCISRPSAAAEAGPPSHASPHQGCCCGLNAYWSPYRELNEVDAVLIAVALWGSADLYPTGVRAARGVPVAIADPGRTTVPRSWVQAAASRYGIALVGEGELERAGRRHAQPPHPSLIPTGAGPSPPERPGGPGAAHWFTELGLVENEIAHDLVQHVQVTYHGAHVWIGASDALLALIESSARVRLLARPRQEILPGDPLAVVDTAQGSFRVCSPAAGFVTAINRRVMQLPQLLVRPLRQDGWLVRLLPAADPDSPLARPIRPASDDEIRNAVRRVMQGDVSPLEPVSLDRLGAIDDAPALPRSQGDGLRLDDAQALVGAMRALLERDGPLAQLIRRAGMTVDFQLRYPDLRVTLLDTPAGARLVLDHGNAQPTVGFELDAGEAAAHLFRAAPSASGRYLRRSVSSGDAEAVRDVLETLEVSLPLARPSGRPGQLTMPF